MIMFKTGKLFCQRYNQEKGGEPMSAKDIFSSVLVPIIFDEACERVIANFGNGPFKSNQNNKHSRAERLENFHRNLSTTTYGLEGMTQVYGGMASPGSTTEHNFNTNLSFSEEERYYSWIGSLFGIDCKLYNVYVNHSDLIWDLFQAMPSYREFVDENISLISKPAQLTAWNGWYLWYKYVEQMDSLDDIQYEIFSRENKKNCSKGNKVSLDSLPFTKLLLILSFADFNVKYLECCNIKGTGQSCAPIIYTSQHVKTLHDIYSKMLENDNTEHVNTQIFDEVFGEDVFLSEASEKGYLGDCLISIIDVAKKHKKILKILKIIMNKSEIEIADALINELQKMKEHSGRTLKKEINSLLGSNSKSLLRNVNALKDLMTKSTIEYDCTDFTNIIDKLVKLPDDKIDLIIDYAKFKHNN